MKTKLKPEIHAATNIAATMEEVNLTEYMQWLVQADLEAPKRLAT